MRVNLLVPAFVPVIILIMASLVACTSTVNSPPAPSQAQPGSQSAPENAPPAGPGDARGMPGQPPSGGNTGGGPGLLNQPASSSVFTSSDTNKTLAGDGTISVSGYADLYFGSAGRIEKINVKPGHKVAKDTELARLDTTSLEASLSQAQVSLNQARLAQSQARVNLDQAQVSQIQMDIALSQAYLSQIQARSALASAQFNLDKVSRVSEIKDLMTDLQQHIAAAEVNKKIIKTSGSSAEFKALNEYILEIEEELEKQKSKLSALLSTAGYSGANSLSYDALGQTYDRLTVEDARLKQLAVEAAQKSLDQCESSIELAKKNVEKAQDSLVLAQQTCDMSGDGIDLAQKNLEVLQVQIDRAVIIAPFDGVIAAVNHQEGDFISAPAQMQSPVIYLVDLTTLELDISINELDIPAVEIGQKARISIDAYPELVLDGHVSNISLLPSTQGGIVDYTLTITFPAPADINIMIGMHASASIDIE
ncbi:MAG: HlyD family efflux transporter periplasmic adaptor subunit [Dehalococcoidales bacterium]|nr:HlyD family efflux transporter periplasmic adaptor subunit [Dehalococcoidales bacterium]